MSTLDAITALADAYETEYRSDKAETLYQRALLGYEKVSGPENLKTLGTVRSLGHMYWRQNKFSAVEGLFQRALQGSEKTLGIEHPVQWLLCRIWAVCIETRTNLQRQKGCFSEHCKAMKRH